MAKKKKLSKEKALEMLKNPPKNQPMTKKQTNYFKQVAYGDSGIIVDNEGQKKFPGKVTKILSPNISMENINYPVLGISDLNDVKMMYPNQNYIFEGNEVTEIPVGYHKMPNGSIMNNKEMQQGGSLKMQLNDILLKTALLKERTQKRDSIKQDLMKKFPKTQGKVNQGMLEYFKTEPKEYLNLDVNLLDDNRRKLLLEAFQKSEYGSMTKELDDLTNFTNYNEEAKSGIHIKKSHRGLLHKNLGVAEGEKIPASKLKIKSTDSPAVKKRKQFALNAKHFNHNEGGTVPYYEEGEVYDLNEEQVEHLKKSGYEFDII